MQFLPEAWGSVQSQTFQNWELIIVDDGSSDHIRSWGNHLSDSRVRFIHQPNQGKSCARNRGILVSRGRYIAFLDADDLWDETKLEKQVAVLDQRDAVGLVYTWTMLVNEGGQPTGRMICSTAEGNVMRQLILKNLLGCGSTPLVRRRCFEVAGTFYPDLPLAQDWDMWIRIAAYFPFAVIPEPLVRYRQHARNTSTNWSLMESCRDRILQRAIAQNPDQLAPLESEACGRSNLYLGWLAIRTFEARAAFHFWWKTSRQSLELGLSRDALRLLLAVVILALLGAQNYTRMTDIKHRYLVELYGSVKPSGTLSPMQTLLPAESGGNHFL